jgi:hypothetical protein
MLKNLWLGLGFAAALGLGSGVWADELSDRELARDDEIQELKRQLTVVVEEVERLRTETAVPEEAPLESTYGLGPAASKVYGARRKLSLGGYAEALYTKEVDATGSGEDTADFLRSVLYVGYKFTDQILFNSEIEIEHASTDKEGSVSLEFATLDYLYRDDLNFRAGLLLVPMGFLNEMHEPPFYYGTHRPEPESRIIPTTWRENGFGIFGSLTERLHYRAYVVNGFRGSDFDSSGLRGGRQKGSKASANDMAVVVRADFDVIDGLRIGGSYYNGEAGQNETLSMTGMKLPDTPTTIWEAHADYRLGALHMRGLYTQSHVGDAGSLSSALTAESGAGGGGPVVVSRKMIGGYGEVGYDLMPLLFPGSEKSLVPFFRFEYLDTQNDVPSGLVRDRSKPRRIYVPGIQFYPIPSVVLKLDYRNIDNWTGTAADQVNVGFGLVF